MAAGDAVLFSSCRTTAKGKRVTVLSTFYFHLLMSFLFWGKCFLTYRIAEQIILSNHIQQGYSGVVHRKVYKQLICFFSSVEEQTGAVIFVIPCMF